MSTGDDLRKKDQERTNDLVQTLTEVVHDIYQTSSKNDLSQKEAQWRSKIESGLQSTFQERRYPKKLIESYSKQLLQDLKSYEPKETLSKELRARVAKSANDLQHEFIAKGLKIEDPALKQTLQKLRDERAQKLAQNMTLKDILLESTKKENAIARTKEEREKFTFERLMTANGDRYEEQVIQEHSKYLVDYADRKLEEAETKPSQDREERNLHFSLAHHSIEGKLSNIDKGLTETKQFLSFKETLGQTLEWTEEMKQEYKKDPQVFSKNMQQEIQNRIAKDQSNIFPNQSSEDVKKAATSITQNIIEHNTGKSRGTLRRIFNKMMSFVSNSHKIAHQATKMIDRFSKQNVGKNAILAVPNKISKSQNTSIER